MEQVSLDIKIREHYDKDWDVIMYNDDTTPIELVIHALMEVFDYSMSAAYKIAYEINDKTHGVVGTYPKKLAIAKSKKAMEMVHELGYTEFKVEARG